MSDSEKKDIKSIEIIPPEGKASMGFTIKGEDGKTITVTNPKIIVKQSPNEDITLRDENVQEILTSAPHWMIRWGNILFLSLVLLILFLAWFIKYPDTISEKVSIEQELNSNTHVGYITSKNFTFEKVKKGQIVQLSLLVYPEYENGVVMAVVDTVFWNKPLKQYEAKISLPQGLTTTYEVDINPNTNLEAQAKIILKDKRLIEHIFNLK
ncbi:hypothetical protein [uncultured Psychroserpens sp.]|uniref:hypothetical protein n=1 Tax=uncultured Psychroserpens sp. TaxID=255436 RepID=UPI00262C1A88|nr:hypothetical protein [uncultured Psychroserpens sp.]